MEVYTLTCVETYNDEFIPVPTQTTVFRSREDAVTSLKAYIKTAENSYRAQYEDVEIEFNSGDGWKDNYDEIHNTNLNIISMLICPKDDYCWENIFFLKKHEI